MEHDQLCGHVAQTTSWTMKKDYQVPLENQLGSVCQG